MATAIRRALLATLFVASLAGPALAQSSADQPYPNRPVRLIVPYAPGGPSDLAARVLVQRLSPELGQPVVIESRPGAAGVVGTDMVAKAPPDGYTVALGSGASLAIAPNYMPNAPYDPLRDFAPVTVVVGVTEVIAVRQGLPVRTLAELVALARNTPRQVTYASAGIGSTPHLATELLRLTAGFEAVHVPYRGGNPLVLALVSGEADFGFADMPIMLPQIRAGTIRPIAVGSRARSPLLPEVPTLDEAGVPDLEVENWHGLVLPARTPPAVVAALHRATVAALRDPEVARALEQQGARPGGNTPEEFAALIRAEHTRWAEVIRRAGIKPE
jgi:tripartite-type tricarboxylate transporter receptor subunit TctC